jgi:hypothetical protein
MSRDVPAAPPHRGTGRVPIGTLRGVIAARGGC